MTQKPRNGGARRSNKISKISRESIIFRPLLEACALVDAVLGNPSLCILDPRLELAQVLHKKWGHFILFPSSFESQELFRLMNQWKRQATPYY